MSLLKVNEIQIFNGTTVTITATTTETSADLNVGADLDVTGALTLGTALAIAEGGTGATDAATARTNLDVDQAGTDNSTDCTLVTTSHDYLSITGQAITLGPIDLAADVTGSLPYASISGTPTLGTAAAEDVGYFATAAQGALADSAVQPGDDADTLGSGAATDGYVLTADGAGGAAWEAKAPIDLLSSGASIRKSDGTTAVLSESGGAVTLENVTNAYLSGGVYLGGTVSANYLDDYEEGTWTPVLEGATTAGTYTYDATRTLGTYTKIGNTVFLSGSLKVSGVTSAGTGDAIITGLPFTPSRANQGSYPRRPHPVLLQGGATLSLSSIFASVETDADYIGLYTQSTSTIAAISVTDADFVNSIWAFSVVYKVT